MADTHPHSPTQKTHAARGSDMGAAYAGLVIGALSLLLLLGAIVTLTNRYYASEKPAKASER